MIYIIADDITGANDTGVQFAKNGYRTVVSILGDKLIEAIISDNLDVFVIDTETREVEEKVARDRLRNIIKVVNIAQEDLVYKKVDSTLRGNIGAELEEIMKCLKRDVCIFSPSFPLLQRTTVDGSLIVEGKPCGLTEYSSSVLNNKNSSSIEYILKKQSTFPIGQINLKIVNKGEKDILNQINHLHKEGKKIIIIDSVVEEDLESIIKSSTKFKGSILLSGSAGLAKHFSQFYNKKRFDKINIYDNKGPIIIVAGSRNPIMMTQIKYLKNKIDLKEIKIDLEQIFSNKLNILETYIAKGVSAIKNSDHLIIYTDTIHNEEKSINKKIMIRYNLCFRELEVKIKNIFSELTSKIIKNTCVRNLILTGGDIAFGVCKELGISNLTIINELLPGIPLSSAYYENIRLNIITKAGGFGTKNTLHQLINKLVNY